MDFNDIQSFTYPIRKETECDMAWVFDMYAYTDYQEDLKIIKAERKLLCNDKKMNKDFFLRQFLMLQTLIFPFCNCANTVFIF